MLFLLAGLASGESVVRAESPGAIQGPGHRSPLEGRNVSGIEAVVTAVLTEGRSPGYWVEDPAGDGDERTSDGLWVPGPVPFGLTPGERVRLAGQVREEGRVGELPVTQLVDVTVERLGRADLPPAVRLGREGRPIPGDVVDDDGLTSFDPSSDAVDFWESLEGMRVRVDDAAVVGATSSYGEIFVLVDSGWGVTPRTGRGGLLITASDSQGEVVAIAPGTFRMPDFRVGDLFKGPLVGVVDYAYGSYRLVLTEPPREAIRAEIHRDRTMLLNGPGRYTVATYNVHNLGGDASDAVFRRLARSLVEDLGAPDVVALEEIEDASGGRDDGTTTAEPVLSRLVAAVGKLGGPEYDFRQIDPEDNRDGGAPGANIRTVLLFRPDRATFHDRGPGEGRPPAELDGDGRLVASPAVLGDADTVFRESRKPLVAELEMGGRTLWIVATHLVSKRGDDPEFGARQPPAKDSEKLRSRQARLIADFVRGLLSHDPQARVIVLGDLNEHEFRPPLAELAAAGLENLIERVPEPERYTYNYQGRSEVLDHILVSPALAGGAEVDIAHVNADFPARGRISDHDPVVARFRLR